MKMGSKASKQAKERLQTTNIITTYYEQSTTNNSFEFWRAIDFLNRTSIITNLRMFGISLDY